MRILLAEKSSFSPRGIALLQGLAPTDACDLTQQELAARAVDYDILVVRLGLSVDAPVLSSGRLKVVATPTTGLDHIDLDAAARAGVAVLSLKGERAFLDQVYATAEHTMALLLSLLRRIPAAFNSVQAYHWRRDLYRGCELGGKTLGIVGCGRLGTMVARYAGAFGMAVLAYDPYQPALPEGVQRCASLDELLERSDIVSLHAPLNGDTRGMISAAEFAVMRPGACLVNTARGALVDENALLDALQSGRLAGAALDVLCDEHRIVPGSENPLIEYARTHDNLIITPHIGGATSESVEKADLFIIEKIQKFLKENGS